MTAKLLSGKVFSDAIKAEVAAEVADIREVHGFSPCLVVVRVGEDPASAVYVGSKVRTAEELGIRSEQIHFAADASENEIIDAVRGLNARTDVDGILVQLPLPKHIDEQKVLELIDPEKDVDGFHPVNAGRLMQGQNALKPCTPAGVIEVLKRSGITIAGKNAVVVGRSNIVGKPMAMLLLHENATVTICHSRTADLADVCSRADILVAAIGRAGFIKAEHIGQGATVVDVGINNVEDPELARELFGPDDIEKRLATIEKRGFTLVGDVNPRDAMDKAAYFTPVPGGIGLLTVAMLMKNTVTAARMRRRI
ncbi:MAG TPA: bifunctional methylenetetrahydrofolate dehydrogenase/methenyltetrahydrofolate cyclohydrolase FolD [Pyrinomonadaceae bacterium]|nr:bifunctional methylenetetrahydrofolate dehydrogenase/methenyltetrahydrofolate cyclohydrolase FolD [Chloracidobacterium sp.]MBP9934229.1 bifunctional methylenetetrahydrofolate dehydrogenase/methenyltetrahydrofolate cyclohydrolase FolD [Pyrinomonadaceae bacterium]MBK7801575.1 bifunctional methylenetetrahydrofolate dehydrogenase/methenyltetrahydrofolate cyclohydrolase FolD [Chloracidobacterium sp.]MBK9436891.1 bifunctional methylenetetrahydrofolate dehydrogenase/methenyltetrahydrofolate cyclohyd